MNFTKIIQNLICRQNRKFLMLYLCYIYAIFKHSISPRQKIRPPHIPHFSRKDGGKGENLFYFMRSPLALPKLALAKIGFGKN